MSSKAMSLKAKIRNYAKKNNIAAQVVLQNYMFERFLARLSESEYKDKFVIKGGMLIAAIVGLDTQSTMDLDATLRGLLERNSLSRAAASFGLPEGIEPGPFLKSFLPDRLRIAFGNPDGEEAH